MLLPTIRATVHLLLLSSGRTPSPRCAADDDLGAALSKAGDVDLGDASDSASKALAEMQAARAKRLEAMGASTAPPPPPSAPKERGQFSISNAAASSDAAAATLARMRRRETGELETEHVEQIERAIRVSKQWLDAKLPARAKAELEEVEKFMTYKSEAGADFHLLLAKVAEANGEPAQARRVLQRVSKDAVSSSQRWQADQVLGSTGGAAPPSSPSQPNELGNLFQMPNQWGD